MAKGNNMRIDCAGTPTLIAILLCGLLAGCIGGVGNTHVYYLIDPVADAAPNQPAERPLAIEIQDLHIPQYLEKFQIATRDENNRLKYAEYKQWGENLRKNLTRTLARNLEAMLGTQDVGTPQNRSMSAPDYRLHVHIEQFERDRDARVRLIARWQLSRSSGAEVPEMHNANLMSELEIDAADYDALVAEMQSLYGELCRRIAESIRAHESGE
jgi:uncharacterized lipoprotein YmbA